MQEMIEAADFVVIPVQASTPDLLSTQDAVVLAREAGASYLVVFNAVDPKKRFAENAREFLFNADVPIAAAQITRRDSHPTGTMSRQNHSE